MRAPPSSGGNGSGRLQLCVEPWNAASAQTAESVGFQREGLLRSWQLVGEERRDMVLYSMLGTDLPSLRPVGRGAGPA
ncbi:GNAT family protein [Streptomyces sp. NPDC005408]|uniref:GNAT family N-acetyltransferase n=1 Tax=Streptomyces sp. NPDC005408 TaxID=3155341 RepID=UPI0033A2CFB6